MTDGSPQATYSCYDILLEEERVEESDDLLLGCHSHSHPMELVDTGGLIVGECSTHGAKLCPRLLSSVAGFPHGLPQGDCSVKRSRCSCKETALPERLDVSLHESSGDIRVEAAGVARGLLDSCRVVVLSVGSQRWPWIRNVQLLQRISNLKVALLAGIEYMAQWSVNKTERINLVVWKPVLLCRLCKGKQLQRNVNAH